MLNDIRDKIMALEGKQSGTLSGITRDEVKYLCDTATEIFRSQPILLEIKPPLVICGDIHGQLHDLFDIFNKVKYPPATNFLFLGDYVDRGRHSIETVCLLLIYKIKHPTNFFMLRGNHECAYINKLYGFYDECQDVFGDPDVWRMFCDLFQWLPVAAIIEQKIFCVHGGISPDLTTLDDIRNIKRPIEIPDEGLLCDLVWSDPSPDVSEWEDNERGTSWCFGEGPVNKFLEDNDFDLICRGHQAVMSGYEFPFPDQTLITLFSAPNYCNEYENKGAVLKVDENLLCSFEVLEPKNREEVGYDGGRPPSPVPFYGR